MELYKTPQDFFEEFFEKKIINYDTPCEIFYPILWELMNSYADHIGSIAYRKGLIDSSRNNDFL